MQVSGSERPTDSGSDVAATTSAATALAAGFTVGAIGMVSGPVTALAVFGVAAYTGSMVGAMNGMMGEQTENLPKLRPAGVILAVRIARRIIEKREVSDLRNSGNDAIEQAEGEWRDGNCVDFKLLQEPTLVAA